MTTQPNTTVAPAPGAAITNPTPKARFMSSNDNISKHRDMVGSREFERACDFALMEYQTRLCMAVEPANQVGAVAMAMRILGAHEFLQTLRNLGETPKILPTVELPKNLDHRA